jgi:hypothetical protein
LFPLYGPFRDATSNQYQTAREIRDSRPAVVVYIPNSMFFAPGTDQFLTRWMHRYLQREYQPRYVASIDPIGAAGLRPADAGTSPDTLRAGEYAIIYTRRETAP